VTRFRGRVERRRVAPGSKSERVATVLVTEDDVLRLRRRGENPFDPASFCGLVGERIVCDGTRSGGALIVSRWWREGEAPGEAP
jgi:hypothetical protein